MSQPNSYKAYNRATATVSKTRQVVMLYDGIIRFLQQAIEAIEKKDYELRYQKLTRAADIVMGLQGALDFDMGGKSARILYDFYAGLDLRLLAIHRSNDVADCNAMIAQIKQMRDVWYGIDRGSESPADAAHAEQSAASAMDTSNMQA
jgi:flagellar secretion chaperone FliS